jgi:peroxiredoxin Q/BCP
MSALLSLLLLLAAGDGRPGPGDVAPAFSLPATGGKTVALADYKGKTVVLAFYPKAFTGGCTKEMSAFRDRHPEFTGEGVQILGLSADDLETQGKFAESLKVPFPLVADPEGTAIKAYGVWNEGRAKRVTFVIGGDGKVIAVFEGTDALDPGGALGACRKPVAP